MQDCVVKSPVLDSVFLQSIMGEYNLASSSPSGQSVPDLPRVEWSDLFTSHLTSPHLTVIVLSYK